MQSLQCPNIARDLHKYKSIIIKVRHPFFHSVSKSYYLGLILNKIRFDKKKNHPSPG